MKLLKSFVMLSFLFAGIQCVAAATETGYGGPTPSTGPVVSTGTCTGEHIVYVTLVSSVKEAIIGGLESGGSSGFYLRPYQTFGQSLSSTSGKIQGHLQVYFKDGVPYPENYIRIDVWCEGTYDFAKSCGTSDPVATMYVYDQGQGGEPTFGCYIATEL